jgi:hypothetical protein
MVEIDDAEVIERVMPALADYQVWKTTTSVPDMTT